MPKLRAFDLNLLTVFDAVCQARNITDAAEQLGLTQSAVGDALSRLSEALRDDLFVNDSEALKPTVTAEALYPVVRSALDGIRGAIAGTETFDPARALRSFRVAIPYVIGPFVAVQLGERLKVEAPMIKLAFDTHTIPTNLLEDLKAGRTDVAVDWWSTNEAQFIHHHVFDDRLMVVARRDHPRIREAPSLALLGQEQVVGLHRRTGQWARPPAVVQALALRDWKIAINVNEFLEVPLLVASTNLVSVMPMSMAATLEATGLVRLLPFPVHLPPVQISMIWHAGRTPDPAHMWLRRIVCEEASKFAGKAFAALPQ